MQTCSILVRLFLLWINTQVYNARFNDIEQISEKVVDGLVVNRDIPHPPQIVRLRGDPSIDMNFNEGRVEIYNKELKKWGIIYDDFWDEVDANVVCKQLGFDRGAVKPYRGAQFGVSGLPVDDMLAGSVRCSGLEERLQSCSFSWTHMGGRHENYGSVQCIHNPGCENGWDNFGGRCYKLFSTPATFLEARKQCLHANSTLLISLSKKENNFISDWLYIKHSNISSVWTAGMFMTQFDNSSRKAWTWQDSIPSMSENVSFSAWFPGFVDNVGKRPTQDVNNRGCLALNRLFKKNATHSVDTNYFWWDNESCKSRLAFVCEKLAPHKDCFEDSDFGASYRGTASITQYGTSCLFWNENKIVNSQLYSNKGLEGNHNYCRNPDEDAQPWCWVDHIRSTYGYCLMSKCSDSLKANVVVFHPQSSKTETAGFNSAQCRKNYFHCPSMIGYTEQKCISKDKVCDGNVDCFIGREDEEETFCRSYLCLSNQFFCARDIRCIWAFQVCDGVPQCSDGLDEINCPHDEEFLNDEFIRLNNTSILLKENSMGSIARFKYQSERQCASLCKSYWGRLYYEICRGFNYEHNDPTSNPPKVSHCLLILAKKEDIILQPSSTPIIWYASKIHMDCNANLSLFHCANDNCVQLDKRCNVEDNCGDFSDETNCTYISTPMKPILRLINHEIIGGSQGRVEITYNGETGLLCDKNLTMNDANVICLQLGYPKALAIEFNAGRKYGPGNDNFMLSKLRCLGNESNIFHCRHSDWKKHRCSTRLNIAGIICAEDRGCKNQEYRCDDGPGKRFCIHATKICDGVRDCFNGSDEHDCQNNVTVQLSGPKDSKSGTVLLIRNGVVGSVCDDEFEQTSAQVVCRELGFFGDARVLPSGGSHTTGITWFEHVRCVGNESRLVDCPHGEWGKTTCNHDEDLNIECGILSSTVKPRRNSSINAPLFLRAPSFATTKLTPRPVECGIQLKRPSLWRIGGGYEPAKSYYSWQVAIRIKLLSQKPGWPTSKAWCGGTIIDEFHIVSASHCFDNNDFTKSNYLIRVGDFDNVEIDNTEQEFDVETIIKHEKYTGPQAYDYDITIVRIKPKADGRGILWTHAVLPLCLPQKNVNTESLKLCHVSGWGRLANFRFPRKLQAAELPIFPRKNCTELYQGTITERMICAGFYEGGIDTCQGDSGGPLACEIEGRHVLIGVTSFGGECGMPGKPGIYVNVPYFIDWIQKKIKRY